MYDEHPAFTPPPEDAVLWRYLDVAKFFALLEHGALHFARADTLGDPYEGSYGAPNVQLRPVLYRKLSEAARRNLPAARKATRNLMYVNCWHRNEFESEAMWNLYATRDRGIAVRTTFASLRDSIADEQSVYVGEVSYVDHGTTFIDELYAFTSFLHKRKSFEHEHEIRAMILHAVRTDSKQGPHPHLQPAGINCDVDLSKLIEEVVVTPFAEDWLVEVVQAVAGRYSLTAPIRRSALASEPYW